MAAIKQRQKKEPKRIGTGDAGLNGDAGTNGNGHTKARSPKTNRVSRGQAAPTFQVVEVESNPHLVQIVAPSEVVVVIGFEIKMNTRVGTMSLCIPYNVIEPVMAKLATQGWLAYQRRAAVEDKAKQIGEVLQKATLDLTAYLAETTITVRDLVNLQPGDILQTAKPANEELILQVRGRNKFAGIMGRHKDHFAFKITRPASDDEGL